MFRTKKTVFFVVASLALAASLPAQTALVKGVVLDSDRNPLPGTLVTVTSEQLGRFRKTLTTDKDGEFKLRFQPNQTQYVFDFLFEKPGFQSFTQPLSPSSMDRDVREFIMEVAESQVVESHGNLGAVVSGSTNEAVESFNAGLTAQREGDLETARASFSAALEADPSLVPAKVALAQVELDLGNYDDAIAAADNALASAEGNPEAIRVKYQALVAAGRKDEAEAISTALSAAEEAVANARRLYNEGAAAFQADNKEEALGKFRQAAELDPSLVEAHHAIATLEYANGNYQASAESAKTALSLGSDDVRTLRVLYDAYQALDLTEELTEIAPRLAAVDPAFGGPKLIEQAADLWNAGRTEQAASLAQLALSLDDSLAKAYYFVGLNHLAKGDNDAAKANLTRFLELAPEDSEAQSARDMLAYIQ